MSPSSGDAPVRRLLGRAVTGLLLATASALLAPLGASAHDRLLDTVPSDGESVTSVPAAVELRFNNPVAEISAEIEVRDAAGATVGDTPATVDGALVTAPLPADLADGAYTVAWRVVSSDGHPIEGTFGFSVTGSAGGSPSVGTPSPDQATPTGQVDEPSATSGAPTGSPTSPEPAGDPSTGHSPGEHDAGVPTWVLGMVGLGIVAGAITLLVRRRRPQ